MGGYVVRMGDMKIHTNIFGETEEKEPTVKI
jgi:hypothetical protein